MHPAVVVVRHSLVEGDLAVVEHSQPGERLVVV